MKLKVLGSSSKGNCFLLENEKECLVLECGIRCEDIKKALNYDIGKISGCLLTHEHGDHAKYANDLLKHSIDIYASIGTWEALNISNHRSRSVEAHKMISIGSFKVIPFKTEHDAAEPLGYLINHDELGTLLFATDTYYLKNRFDNLNHILIECNYKMSILDENFIDGRINGSVRNRIIESHMELETCKEFLISNDLSRVNTIVLLHLSEQNGNAKEFVEEIERLTGKATYVATEGLEVEMGKELF